MDNKEKWEVLKQAVEAARVRYGAEISVNDVSAEIPYDRGDFSREEIREAIYLLTDQVPDSYRAVVEVASRFLKRKATIGELRQALAKTKQTAFAQRCEYLENAAAIGRRRERIELDARLAGTGVTAVKFYQLPFEERHALLERTRK